GGDSAHNLIDPVDGTVGYFTMYRDYVFRRFNTATPHTSVNVRPSQFDDDASCNFFPTFSMNPSSPTHIIAACQQVVRTLDGPTVTPESWTTIGQPFADPVTATYEAPNNSNVIYAVAAHGEVWMTTNANAGTAAVWRNVTRDLPGGIWTIAVHPTDPQTAYLACDSGMYKTTDMGTTWMQQGVQNLIYRDVAIDPLNPQHIFAASNAGVFASTDGGLSWGNMSDGIPAGLVVTALSLMPVVGSLPLPPLGVEFTCFIWIRLRGRVPLRGPGHDFKRMSMFDSILIAPLSGMFRFHKSKSAISSK